MNKKLVIGIGNELRGDDAIGVHIVQALEKEHPGLAEYLIEQHDLSRIIEKWVEKEVVIIDAIFPKKPEVGKVHLAHSFEEWKFESDKPFSSHSLGLIEMYKLAKELNKSYSSLLLIGIEGENWGFGDDMSGLVSESIEQVKDLIINRLS
ncbi:MAG: hydrogenase maturation protease [Bacteroidota bacterium]